MKYFFLVSLYAFACPQFLNIFGNGGIVFVNGGIMLLILIFALIYGKKNIHFSSKEAKKFYLAYAFVFIVFLAHLSFSYGNGIIFGDVKLIFRDIVEWYRPIFMLIVFSFAFYIFIDHNERLKKLYIIFKIIFIFMVFMGTWQLIDRGESFFLALYTKMHVLERLRMTVPFVNPYDFAFVMNFFVFWFFVEMTNRSIKYLPFFCVAFVCVFLTQSRIIMVSMIFALFFIVPFLSIIFEKFKSKICFKKFLILFSILALLLSLMHFIIENLPYITYAFIKLAQGGGIDYSANARLDQFLFAFDKATNPMLFLFGNGPSKEEMEYVESMYAYQFYRYGLVGMILYFVYPIVLSSILLCKILKQLPKNTSQYTFCFGLLTWFLAMPIMLIGNNLTEQIRSSFFYYSILAIIACMYVNMIKGKHLEKHSFA